VKKILDAVLWRVEEKRAHGAVLVLVTEKLQRAAALRGLPQREAILCVGDVIVIKLRSTGAPYY
jgi:hypothetical protein